MNNEDSASAHTFL